MARKKDYRLLNTTPFETGIKNFTSVARYYLYYSPNIDSCQSVGCIEGHEAEQVFEEMMSSANLKTKFRVMKRISHKAWSDFEFDVDEIDFEDSRMLFDMYNNETELKALLRHIRNSFAHGYIYVWRKKRGDYILLIDYDKGKNKATAKLLVSMSILERWKAILENKIAIGE